MRIKAMLWWLFGYGGYLWPTNLFLLAVTSAAWLYTQPEMARCTEFEWGWIAQIFFRNQEIGRAHV